LNVQPGQKNVDELYNTFVNTGVLEYNVNTSGRIVGNVFSGRRPVLRHGLHLHTRLQPGDGVDPR
jgi:hypothetical protein